MAANAPECWAALATWPDLLDVGALAQLLGVRPEWVRAECHRGALRAARIGKAWRIRPVDAIAWFDARVAASATTTIAATRTGRERRPGRRR